MLAEVIETDRTANKLTLKGQLSLMNDPRNDNDTVPLGDNGTGLMLNVPLNEVSNRPLSAAETHDALTAMRANMLTPITTVEVAQLRQRLGGRLGGVVGGSHAAASAPAAGGGAAAGGAAAQAPTYRSAMSDAALARVGDVP